MSTVCRQQAAGTGGVQRMARRVVVMAHTSCSTLNINIFPPRLYKYWEGGITVETDSGCSVHFINQAFSDVFCAVGFSADSQPW